MQDAYEKDAKNPDTLANLVTVGLHMGKNTCRFNKCVGSFTLVFRLSFLGTRSGPEHTLSACLTPASSVPAVCFLAMHARVGKPCRAMVRCASASCLLCSQLKTAAPTHVAVKRIEAADEAFNRAAASFVAA